MNSENQEGLLEITALVSQMPTNNIHISANKMVRIQYEILGLI